jgi:4-amino-4-deoxy-L-arabinose transferase-like glycosyltransferase
MDNDPVRPATAFLTLLLLWAAVITTSLLTRSYFPVDETRYVGVAWEMWLRGDFLVPHLNGEPYSHKPPLLFWLYQAGWWLFGVNDWWPRLVAPLFSLAGLLLTAKLARLLWPERENIAATAPLLLFGTLLWTFYSTMAMFDMLVACFALLGMLGMAQSWRGKARQGWTTVAFAIGLGILAKGPVILLHGLPVAVLAPWWARDRRPAHWKRWYAGLAAAVLGGAAIALCWVIPAAVTGGEEYRQAILWGQTAGRLGGDHAPHARPLWWYLPLLPLILFPWIVWPPLWRGLRGLRAGHLDDGARFTLAWMIPVFVVFSLISGKQVQYPLPLLPAFALLATRALSGVENFSATRDARLPGLFLVIGGIMVAVLHAHAGDFHDAEWLDSLSAWWGLPLVLGGLAALRVRCRGMYTAVLKWTAASVLLLITLHAGLVRVAMTAYDLRPISRFLYDMQQSGRPIAHLGNYHDQYAFLGRLTQPFTELREENLPAWTSAHPDGRVVVYYRLWHAPPEAHAEFTQSYRGRTVAVWDAAVLRDHPDWALDPP